MNEIKELSVQMIHLTLSGNFVLITISDVVLFISSQWSRHALILIRTSRAYDRARIMALCNRP